jgi:hypothetical protein
MKVEGDRFVFEDGTEAKSGVPTLTAGKFPSHEYSEK